MRWIGNGRNPLDWPTLRDRIDLAAVADRLLGPAPGRRGERGRRLWWNCPLGTHPDQNPSFCIEPGKPRWKCFGCGESGDAATLMMRVEGMSFAEAVRALGGDGSHPGPRRGAGRRAATNPRPRDPSPALPPVAQPPAMPGPSEDWAARALKLVAEAEGLLWAPAGASALRYLRLGRGLSEATIRAARLGVLPPRRAIPGGITIPWVDGPAPTLVNFRRPAGHEPRYMALKGSRRGGIYPGRHVIRPGRPLVIVEGEFDALLLGQELGELAAVVTLGSASARPSPAILGAMLSAHPWYVATDLDEAGDKAAGAWPAPTRRVRPPGPFKDWTDAYRGGVNLRRWWGEILAGRPTLALYTWEDLARWRWGAGEPDPGPGIEIDRRPEPVALIRTLSVALSGDDDPYASAERAAIRSEGRPEANASAGA